MYGFFYGWYLKCQSDAQTLAVIPAVHSAGRKRTCSIQVITDNDAWTVTFTIDVFQRTKGNIFIGENQFGKKGIRLAIHTSQLTIKGKLDFGPLCPLKYDIMGPFALVPFMECRHSVRSMRHSVRGNMCINGQKYSFHNARGYWEGDQGRSFPKEYIWTQCFFPGGSLMLSVADIPMAGIHFTGVIGAILWKGKECRIATYLGARVVQIQNNMVRVIQGNLELDAQLLETSECPLKAPAKGDMVRTIHESVSCRAFYRFCKKDCTLFAFETDRASFEFEYN
ncbi:MAG: tocopherol cyclase family protein, partial [Lachnospiraceae bacterium]|nr:tocopherol cyclase family protein [Lachnospiraceae bacterium]